MKSRDDAPPEDEPLETILARIQPKLRGVIQRYGISVEDAEDLLQQTFLAYVQKQSTIRNPETWLVGTVRKQCLMHLRTCRRRFYHAVDASFLELVARPQRPAQEHTEMACDLNAAISRISPRCRSLLRLRYRLGYEAAEVAARLGYRSSSIRKVTTRCLAALTRQMVAVGYKPADKSPSLSSARETAAKEAPSMLPANPSTPTSRAAG